MKAKLILSVISSMIITGVAAQNNQVLYFMNLPQNHLLNPSLKPVNPVYVGLPALSGITVNETNNYFNFNDIFIEGEEISSSSIAFLDPGFDREGFLADLSKLNYFNPKASVQLLGVGITVGKGLYLFLDINDQAEVNMVAPKEFIDLAFLGNEEFTGQTIDLSKIAGGFNYYREIGIGASKNLSAKFRFGAKAKLLFGIMGGSFQNNGMSLKVNDNYTNTLNANIGFDISGPIIIYTDENNNITDAEFDSERFQNSNDVFQFLTNNSNAGFGMDLGAEYMIDEKITLSASVTDIGFIKWKSDLSNLKATGNIELSGLDFEDIYEGRTTIEDLWANMTDSLKNAFYLSETQNKFTTQLPVGISVGGKYDLNDKFSIGLLSYSKFIGHQLREALTLSANMNIGNKVSTTLAYTACNSNYSNLGIGLAFRASVFQFYFLCDRIPFSWSRAGTGSESFSLPSNWSTLHTRIGLNLVFGNKQQPVQSEIN